MLVADHLLFLLKVGNNLSERLLKNLDLVLVHLDLARLHLGALLILLLRAGVDRDVSLDLLVDLLLVLNLLLVLLQFVALGDRFQSQRLVFFMDLALDRLDSCTQRRQLVFLSVTNTSAQRET